MNNKQYFIDMYSFVREVSQHNPITSQGVQAKQYYLNKEAPTKNDLWQAYYTNAKLDAGALIITPQMVFDAVSNQTELDVTRVYIRKHTDKHCTIEIVCRPVEGWGTFFGFHYIDVVKGLKFLSAEGCRTYFMVKHDPLYDGEEFVSISFYQWYDPPYKFERGWSNG